MDTEQESNATGDQSAVPSGGERKRLPPHVPFLSGRMIAIIILLAILLLAMLKDGSTHPLTRPLTFAIPTTAAQGHPTPSPPPTCPTLRPDPTFGISLIDISTHQALCERNPDGIAQPASTTKVMSALLVKEYLVSHNLTLDATVTAEEIDKEVEWDAAVAYIQVGQAYSVRTLLYMMSIISAADATMALARFVAGSRDAFLDLMNQRAVQIGMTHTHFTSPYGYAETPPDNWQQGEDPSVGNYSSAHDLALLTAAFAPYPDLVAIFGATDYHEGDIWLYRSVSHVLPDSWIGLQAPDEPSPNAVQDLHLPFQVLAEKKGCMWCDDAQLHKISYVLLVRFQQQTVAAAFLYTTQNYFNPLVGDMLPTLLWAFHQCDVPAYSAYCYPPNPTPTPSPSSVP
ncbi:MAG TPA: serine hydrolase [Ktedonobacterales bacterium]|nr:serine hydrolase [Ktedonobacterales bacterium]